MTLDQKIDQIYVLVQKKIKNDELESSLKIINGMLELVEKQFANEFQELLTKSGIAADLQLWTNYSLQFNQQIDSLEIDPWKNIVRLELGSEVLEAPIYNISEYISKIKNLTPAQSLLISSFLTNSVNFKIVQIYHNFLK